MSVSWYFSIRPETYKEAKTMMEGLNSLHQKRLGSKAISREMREEIINQQMDLEEKLTEFLSKKSDASLKLLNENFGGDMVSRFERFISDNYGGLSDFISKGKGPGYAPDSVKRYYEAIKKVFKDEKKRKAALASAEELVEDEFSSDPKDVFDRWTSVIKHAAEHGNWYYELVTLD